MTRFVSVTVLVMGMLAASRVADAQTTLPGGVTLSFDKLYIHEDGSDEAVLPKVDPDSKWKYFNLAHCQCSKAQPAFVEGTFEYLILASGSSPPDSEPLEIWVGPSCTDSTMRLAMCRKTDQAPTISSIQASMNVHINVSIYDAMTPEPNRADCQERVLSATVWGLANSTTGGGMAPLDYQISKSITTDAQPPPLPGGFRASGGDGSIVVSWTPGADTSDVYAYQALCARADTEMPGKTTGRPTQRYMTAKLLCEDAHSVNLGAGTPIPPDLGVSTDGGPVTLPEDMANLDPLFLCGEEVSATASSLRIEGLENGTAYKVILLAVDKFQNAAGTFFTSTVTPVPSTDFWEDLHDRGSNVEGGLCLLAETYGDDSGLTSTLRSFRDDTLGSSPLGRWVTELYYATIGKLGTYVHGSIALRIVAAIVLAPVVALALLWYWLTLPGMLGLLAAAWLWRRRHGLLRVWGRRLLQLRTVRAAAAITVLVLGASHAYAGGGYQPYWEDNDPTDENRPAANEAAGVNWHVGLRFGPYVPDVDAQLGGTSPGPYEQMFGNGYHVLTMLDVDRVLWSGFGQLGVGLSAGYWQKTARTFTIDSMPSDPMRARASDVNKLRLVPTALTATYRFTWLDDEYGIPVVPYARGGLAYYVWWLSLGDGSLATACTGGAAPPCSTTKALGASLGLQGSVGLAIRAERIDASAAMSMRQSGIQHAGIYGELSLAKVDGFGSDKKLSVGDRTWFAGVDFEF